MLRSGRKSVIKGKRKLYIGGKKPKSLPDTYSDIKKTNLKVVSIKNKNHYAVHTF